MTQPSIDFTRDVNVEQDRDQVLAAVERRVDREAPAFRDRAQALVLEHLRTHGPTSGEDLTDAAKRAGLVPPDDRAFGPVYAALSRRGAIVAVGVVRRRRGHGTRGATVWGLPHHLEGGRS